MKKLFLSLLLVLSAITMSAEIRYVFLFIGDGMGMGHVTAAELYNRSILKSENPLLMMQFPVVSMSTTHSANNPVTDSAAAGTALATGSKTRNGMIGMNADTIAVTSVATQLKAMGYGVGVVTSVAYDDATPGAQFGHRKNRGLYEDISHDGADSGFDFIAGSYTYAARKGAASAEKALGYFRNNGYLVAHSVNELTEATADKVLVTASDPSQPNSIGYTIDSIQGKDRLADLTRACLNHLQRVSPNRFYMMVESGLIDHAAHGNDGTTVVKEVIDFQHSIKIAYDFYLSHPTETLIIVTADHDTGGMTIGTNGCPYPLSLKAIDYQLMSKGAFNDYIASQQDIQWDEMKKLMNEKLGLWSHIPVTAEEEAVLFAAFEKQKGESSDTQKTLYKDYSNFTATVFNLMNRKNGYGFTTTNHTGNPVPVYAIGCGAQLLNHLNDNIDIPEAIRTVTGIKK